ncbi:S41 family peptidase [Roseimarinus sediminis]|uniref:S41 family peptidase n=1 Tax=Roseimarinus sediminis TaxID=1610899 RepID=UPI003D233525
MQRYFKILLPLLLSIAVAGGVLLGIKIEQRTSVKPHGTSTSFFQPDKISLLLKLIQRDYVDSIDQTEIAEKVIPEILDELDPHSTYIPASQMKAVSEEMRGNFSGIGVQFVMQKDTVLITDVLSGGPSKEIGILAGDRIVEVDGRNIAGTKTSQDTIVTLLKGKKGTLVNVMVHRPGYPDLLDFTITRGEIPLFSVDVAYKITDNIGLIKVNRFAESTYEEFVRAIIELSQLGAQKLIVDLRGNSGGSLQGVIQMVDEFLPQGRLIVYTEGKSRNRNDFYSSAKGLWTDKDVAVLIDEFSASASEIFAGAIQDNDRGIIIGRRSFGKGLVQEQIPFFDGSALRLTVARFYTPSGRCIQNSYENGVEAYYDDYHERLIQSQHNQADTISRSDSLKYQTIGGRTVFGGGGITPDFHVAVDTTGINRFFSAVASQNLVYHFAFEYADQHRSELLEQNDYSSLDTYLHKTDLFSDLLKHIKARGIKYTSEELEESKLLLQTQLHAYVCRNIFGDDAFYPIIFQIDKVVEKSVELLQNNWEAEKVAAINR